MSDDEILRKAQEVAEEINRVLGGVLGTDDSPQKLDDEQKERRQLIITKYQQRIERGDYPGYRVVWGQILQRLNMMTHDVAIGTTESFVQDKIAVIATRQRKFPQGNLYWQHAAGCLNGLEELCNDLEELALIPVHRARCERGEE